MRKKVLEQEFIRLNADYKALLDETIQLREKVATADEALEKMRATEENVRSIHENTRRLKHDMRNHLMVIAMSLGNEKYDEARTYTAQILDKLNLEYSYIDSGNAPIELHSEFKTAASPADAGTYAAADREP